MSPYPEQCAIKMAPDVLYPNGKLYKTGKHMTPLNEDGTVAEVEEVTETTTSTTKPLLKAATEVASKIATKAGYDEDVQDRAIESMRDMREKAGEGTQEFLENPDECLMHPMDCLSKVTGGASDKLTGWGDRANWVRKNPWCPQKRGICGIMLGLRSRNSSQAVAVTVLQQDDSVDINYLETLSKAEGSPIMGVVYPKELKVECCKMYKVLEEHPEVTFVDFDEGAKKIEVIKAQDREAKLAAAEAELGGDDSASSRVALGVAAVMAAGLASFF
eukprot:gnl/TRDRNA2_/TRDRNA2_82276_c0_seq1.p2 gnl/TRDRNA2_/TRDRNA2_82276_c0~~gnl/TRDRNA2_/TRDRNA2_82276_c0_seq1.p2  ORF type:complete len:317 (+),score=97.79 gnl/TRDRNA2_/TRDRNA2_82276_c0_seq1:131-952(+)